jgi:hypothetical protein
VKGANRSCPTIVDPACGNKIFSSPPATKSAIVLFEKAEFQGGLSKMSGIIYLVGLVVIVMAILSFLGLR